MRKDALESTVLLQSLLKEKTPNKRALQGPVD